MPTAILSPETTVFVHSDILVNYQKEEFTLLHCSYWSPPIYVKGGWVQIWETAYLVNMATQEKLPLLNAIGIPIAPQKHWFKKIGEHFRFTLVFDKIPSLWQIFDLKEPVGNGFSVSNIARNNSGIYRVTIM